MTTDQEGFRFGADDGTESAHTWLAAQDANAFRPVGSSFLLRSLIDAVGDPPSFAPTLRYQKNGSGGYVAVPVGSATSPTIGTPTIGTLAYSTTTTVLPVYPASIAANDTLVLLIGQKPSSANGGTVTTPSGWTLIAQRTGATDGNTGGYGTTLGADTGNVNIFAYTKDSVTGSESGTLSVTIGTNNVTWAAIILVPKTADGTWSVIADTGKDTTGGSVSIASSAGMDVTAGDMLIGAMAIPTDVTTPSQFSAEAFSQTGSTFGTMGELAEPDSSAGSDIGGFIFYQPTSSGSGSGVVTMSATAGGTTTNVRGPGVIVRLRATGSTNELYVATSGNIAAGGEATTARLTPPSGKTTGDFVTGRRWDDENGTDAIDITTDDYTEVEWSLNTQAPAVDTDYYEFRVYADSTALDSYTVTARVTMGDPPPESAVSSTGVGTATGAGAAVASSATSASAAATATAASASIASSATSSAGQASVTAVGAAISAGTSDATATAAGVATATGNGAAIASSAAEGDGQGVGTAEGAALASAAAQASGSAVATVVSTEIGVSAAAASATGASTVTAAAGAIAAAAAQAAGTATTTAAGAATVGGAFDATGTATAIMVGGDTSAPAATVDHGGDFIRMNKQRRREMRERMDRQAAFLFMAAVPVITGAEHGQLH